MFCQMATDNNAIAIDRWRSESRAGVRVSGCDGSRCGLQVAPATARTRTSTTTSRRTNWCGDSWRTTRFRRASPRWNGSTWRTSRVSGAPWRGSSHHGAGTAARGGQAGWVAPPGGAVSITALERQHVEDKQGEWRPLAGRSASRRWNGSTWRTSRVSGAPWRGGQHHGAGAAARGGQAGWVAPPGGTVSITALERQHVEDKQGEWRPLAGQLASRRWNGSTWRTSRVSGAPWRGSSHHGAGTAARGGQAGWVAPPGGAVSITALERQHVEDKQGEWRPLAGRSASRRWNGSTWRTSRVSGAPWRGGQHHGAGAAARGGQAGWVAPPGGTVSITALERQHVEDKQGEWRPLAGQLASRRWNGSTWRTSRVSGAPWRGS